MNWWLRKLLKEFRDSAGCDPVKGEWCYEWPEDAKYTKCRLCRCVDAVFGESWKPLEWNTDESGLSAEVDDDTLVVVNRADNKWKWRIERLEGWESVSTASGEETGLMDAMYAAERAARGL